MNKRIFLITACILFLIIAIQSILHAFAPEAIIIPTESLSYNFRRAVGTAARILGSVAISLYFMKRFLNNGKIIS